RSALGGGIVTSGAGYALDVSGDAIDAVRFENLVAEGRRWLDSKPGKAGDLLREALALWRGRPYADLIDKECLQAEIVRLEELRVGAVEDRVTADLAIGAHSEIVAELEMLTAQHPLRERFRAQQMLALYRAGRQADALRACQRTRDVLVEELGIDPSPELQDLEERILRQDPSLLDDLGPHVERLVVLFTDIEDSTVLWELYPDQMPSVLAKHDRILNELISSNGGSVFKTTGDGVCAIFDGIVEAATAAVAIQRCIATADWGAVEALRVRCAVDLGDMEARDGDYFGPVLNRSARLLAASHGGQILMSADAQAALVSSGEAGWSTRTLGEFRFRGLGRPQQVCQMQAEGLPEEFPPLRIDRLPAPLPGTAFGRSVRGYELRERIGGGDFGIVYRAYQPTVGREVAVKVIRPEYVDQPAFVRQFEAEAQLVAGLEHPHIVSLHDYWRDPDGAYLVMQWLRGGSLRRALDRGPFNAEAALRLLDQICGALGYAHRQGVAHRDLKPGNVLLDDEGNAFLTDFGIAVRLVDASEGRRPQSTSPAYVPPEEIRGEPITVASDIYCLGLLTFELLTGRQPPMDGALPSIETIRPDLPAALAGVITRAIAEDPGDRHSSVSEFLADVRAGFGEAVVEETMRFTATRNPYKGLRPFTETDAADFHGRDQLIADLVAAVADHRLVAVVGPSGLGKSSVVRAGLIPALRAGAVPGSRQWLITTMFPGSYPFEELEAALSRIAEEWPAHAGEELRQDDRGLVRVSKQIIPDSTILLLVIDQFEELFTLTRDEATRKAFLDSLAELVADERGRIRVVLTLRADHFDRPLRYPSFAKLVEQGLVTVSGLTDQELTDAITKPADGVGLNTEPGLEAHILADIHDQPAALPLLQYALTELFAGRHSDTLTIAGYAQTGGLLGALSHRAENLYGRLDEQARQMARQVFLRLVNVGEERHDTRRRVRRSELEGIAHDPTALEDILQTYGDHRLLSFDRDPESREPTVEVAHEALLSEWQRLRTWIEERRDDLVLHRRLVAAVDEWRASGEQAEYLLTGGRLDHFESFVGHTDLAIGRGEAEFLHVSRRGAEASAVQRRRRRRQILTAFAAAAVISLILALVAFGAQQRAEDEALLARARDLASSAVLEAESDPALAMNLAVLAVETLPEGEEPGPALELALRVAKSADRSAGHY
ncbi:MAG: protein kinase, partial [Acidimicrobiia bacterium]|nr:protein kinase [Acidimicrobiia bacterium]